MKIKDVEKRTGITSYNIRFYEKENLLIPKRNPVNGYREYTEEDILWLNRIKMLRMLDIPVSDIRKILYEKEALTSVLNTHLLKIKGLIGPNGAGKSTMLKLMIKKMKPNNGKIIIGDNDIFSIKRENNPVTFIPDIPVYYEELNIFLCAL